MERYQDLDWSKALVTEKSKLAPSDLEPLLITSAGTDPDGNTVYRPYYVVARLLASRSEQITRADIIEFVNPLAIFKESLTMQEALDKAMGLTVPPGMEADPNASLRAGHAYAGPVRRVGVW